ncbi:restriction endonuclease [Nostoc piscinale]|uniref:restriction endonuclease n=1 Tax=Nostoc piscinale TaxID=224012 RepID=UPI000781C177|nr:restriction endonuclease [Nostoc piscinale]
MSSKLTKEEWLTKAAIKERGWTDGAIKMFLGSPEETRKNPHYSSGSPMQLWRMAMVCASEQNPEFIAWKTKHDCRRESLKKRAIEQHQQRRSLLIEWVDSLAIEVPKYSEEQLFKFAVENYNNLWSNRGKFEKLIYQDFRTLEPEFLHRITVNALLHVLSDYEYHLAQVEGLTGASEARSKLKRRVLTSIHKAYPNVTYPELWDWIDVTFPELERGTKHSPIVAAITNLSKQLARLIANDPRGLEDIEWRDMERMLAAVFQGLGFDVTLTPSSKDGGKDLVLECIVKGDKCSYLVEVKHWRSGQRVGKRYISNFINVVARENRDGGLYLATYGYSSDAFAALTEVERQSIKLGVDKKIISLCRTYIKSESGIWLAPSMLSDLLFEDV